MEIKHKSGFVNIFGPPNAGKSTLLNALLGEQLAIVSPKVQTTRHRIHGFLSDENYQIVFSDTPGIIEPKYKLHTKMMQQVKSAIEDTDVAIFLADINMDPKEFAEVMDLLKVNTAKILIINKIDLIKDKAILEERIKQFENLIKADKTIAISALAQTNTSIVIDSILEMLPESPPFFPKDDLSDKSTRFFVSEMIREQIYLLYDKEIPYHAAVLVQTFEELPHVTKIRADIVVTRETQKMILLGKKGMMMKKLGTQARLRIEQFLGQKVFLELFVKVRPKWRDSDNYLKEYGY